MSYIKVSEYIYFGLHAHPSSPNSFYVKDIEYDTISDVIKLALEAIVSGNKIYLYCQSDIGVAGTVAYIMDSLINGEEQVTSDMNDLNRSQKRTAQCFIQNTTIDVYEKLMAYHLKSARLLSKRLESAISK